MQIHERRRRVEREAKDQEALFQWRELVAARYPGLHLMFAIPNGAFLQGDQRRRAMQWSRLKRQGAKEGVSDILLPVPRGGFHGLWIEMKAARPHNAAVSEDQRQWQADMREQGYRAEVCCGVEEAIRLIKDYYGEH